ncbi:phosphate starvation-inducible protein PhoH [Vagococcus coleopterorum]|uniref:PhoH-like protein n=1 Tax=Vagococcus coleopterorum TaxID=2714946 RepID=A0A6G8API3_9ENTE|nr:PhoH family protein [Vagococcus coleopterorum]QIL46897.1 phosphate starvation-inducible protein PhoH [Vagococcus coleopterorum]
MTEVINETIDIQVKDQTEAQQLLGTNDQHLTLIEENQHVTIHSRGDMIQITGEKEAVQQTFQVIKELHGLILRGIPVGTPDVVTALKMVNKGTLEYFRDMYDQEILRDKNGQAIRVKNLGQKHYVDTIKKKDVTFGIGPAGTGKTFLAVVMAIAALKKGEVQKIILTRPAVEAGESLGFLPGDLKEKVDPYLRPVYDALYSVFGMDHTNRLMERGVIEIAPLAYMRGRTLEDAFVILDEAQNTTIAQMKMFLTRLGFNSKMIVNGDASQIDLPRGVTSGLIHGQKTLQGIDRIGFVQFNSSDVVRHPVVAEIIEAYKTTDEVKKATSLNQSESQSK